MISKRVLELVRRMAVDEFGDIPSDEEHLAHAIAHVVEAAEKMSKCGGGCDGPLGCMCGGQIGRDAIKELELALKGCGV